MNDRDMVRALRALADPTRFRMVQEIAAAGELSCGQVAELFDVSQPTISHHLKVLGDAGILVRRQEGKQHFTSVDKALLTQLVETLPAHLLPRSKRKTA
jgi:DNA-binding transcriptional ArsR family regulator